MHAGAPSAPARVQVGAGGDGGSGLPPPEMPRVGHRRAQPVLPGSPPREGGQGPVLLFPGCQRGGHVVTASDTADTGWGTVPAGRAVSTLLPARSHGARALTSAPLPRAALLDQPHHRASSSE